MDFAACPFCGSSVPHSDLQRHANGHFEDDEVSGDMELALSIAMAPPNPPKTSVLGYDLETKHDAFKCHNEANGIARGDDVSCIINLQMKASFCKIEGGLLTLLKKCLESERGDSACVLSGHIDHFQTIEFEDRGWGCGWRNIQMLSSHLLSERREAKEVLFGGSGFVPDIVALQRWLEIAWQKGFDSVGAEHFNHKVYGSRCWIGTTECAALFRSFGLRARIVDFCSEKLERLFLSIPGSRVDRRENTNGKRSIFQIYGPMDKYLNDRKTSGHAHEERAGWDSSRHSSIKFDDNVCSTSSQDSSGSFITTSKGQQVLVDWVWNYFSGGTPIEIGRSKVTLSNKPPLYFQHDGHSRTIIGVQVKHQFNGKRQYNLLVLDPGHKTNAIEKSLRRNSGWQRFFKRGVHTLRKPQYQLCYVDHGIATGEELQQLKTIDSIFIKI